MLSGNSFSTFLTLFADGCTRSPEFWIASAIFAVTFILISIKKGNRTVIAGVGAALMMLLVLPSKCIASAELPVNPVYRYTCLNVLFTLTGIMILAELLKRTGLFQYLALKAVKSAGGHPAATMVYLAGATAFLSAFLDNTSVVLMMMPVTLITANQLKLPPAPFVLNTAFAAGIGGAATLIGNPMNLIIGSAAELTFPDFIVHAFPFVLFILMIYCLVIFFSFRGKMNSTVEQRARIMEMNENSAIADPSALKSACAAAILALIGFLIQEFADIPSGVIVMACAAFALALSKENVDGILEKIDWSFLFFLFGIFIIAAGMDHAGVTEILRRIAGLAAEFHPLVQILLPIWICGLAVSFVGNYYFTVIAAMFVSNLLKISPAFQDEPSLCNLVWWGTVLALSLGTCFSAAGSEANRKAVMLAEGSGCRISRGEFAAWGIPIAITGLLLLSLFITARYFIIAG